MTSATTDSLSTPSALSAPSPESAGGPGEVDLGKLEPILSRYPRERRSVVMVLQDVQAAFGWLPRAALVEVARALGAPRSHVFHVATFFKAFSLEPRGRHVWTVCLGTACHVRGAKLLVEHLERELGVKAGGTTDDLEHTLETVNCVGACALGPLAIVDGTYLGAATATKLDKELRRLRRAASADRAPAEGQGGEP